MIQSAELLGLPPVVRAYALAEKGVELLSWSLGYQLNFPRTPCTWARAVYHLVQSEREICMRATTFCPRDDRPKVDMFISDLGSLAGQILLLKKHCCSPELAEFEDVWRDVQNIKRTQDRSEAQDAFVASYKQIMRGFEEHFVPIRQHLALCRYTAREMYPELFEIPVFERPTLSAEIIVLPQFRSIPLLLAA